MTAIGQRLQDGENIYSSWFSRQADYAVFRAQLIDYEASGADVAIDITFLHKNIEDDGDGEELDPLTYKLTIGDADANGDVKSLDVTEGFKELVRLKFACTNGWVRFRMLQPSWYNTANA